MPAAGAQKCERKSSTGLGKASRFLIESLILAQDERWRRA